MKMVPFLNVVEEVSRGNTKIPSHSMLASGPLPVVDQGSRQIAGYTDNLSARVKSDLPLIVFGDHTRVFKFVDHEFAMGADGIKLLRPTPDLDTRFLFHYLNSVRIPSAGYSRHFKYLKEQLVPLPPLDEQRRIAEILDKADAIRQKRRKAIAHLDALTQSIFHEMFGKLPAQTSFGDVVKKFRNGVSPSNSGTIEAKVLTLSAITQGQFNPAHAKLAMFDSSPGYDKRVSSDDLLICRGNGNKSLVGTSEYSSVDLPELVFPDTIIAAQIDLSSASLAYLHAAWRNASSRRQIESKARTTNGTYKINQLAISQVKIALPPKPDQDRFEKSIRGIDKSKRLFHTALEASDCTFASLQSRAFRGELRHIPVPHLTRNKD